MCVVAVVIPCHVQSTYSQNTSCFTRRYCSKSCDTNPLQLRIGFGVSAHFGSDMDTGHPVAKVAAPSLETYASEG